MEPMTISLLTTAAIQAASGLYQWYNSNEGRKATEAERRKVEELINKIQMPNFDVRDLQPEDYKVVAKFEPRFVQLVKEQQPELLQKTAEARQMRQQQMDVLGQLKELARTGEDPLTALAKVKAMREAGAAAQTQQANLDALMQRRGLGIDSGVGLAMGQAARAQGLDRLGMMGLQNAADAYKRRADAMNAQQRLAGNIFNQEMTQEEKNVNAINAFNQRMADIQNKQNVYNTDIYNKAMYEQQGTAQDVANRSVANKNQMQQFNRTMQNKAQQDLYNAQLNKATAMGNLSNERVKDITDFTRDRNQQVQGWGDLGSGIAYSTAKNWKHSPKESSVTYADVPDYGGEIANKAMTYQPPVPYKPGVIPEFNPEDEEDFPKYGKGRW